MAGDDQGTLYPVEQLRAFTQRAFTTVGVPEADARIVTDNLIEANLRGVDTHGITRLLAIYIRRLKVGIVKARPNIRIVSDNPSSIVVDGDNGLGAVVGAWAMRAAIARAGQTGACWAGIRNSNHFGATAYFTTMAANADMVGIGMTNGPASMAPWGGKEPYFSTNPFSFAVPGQDGPVVIDMATSVAARGHILLAATKGQATIPAGWALDKEGRPTTDTQAALEGTVMPMAGYKGAVVSMMIDILCGCLTGAAFGPHIGPLYGKLDTEQNIGHLLGAIDVGKMVPVPQFKERLAEMCREVKAIPLAAESTGIFIPGEIEAGKKARRQVAGIPIADGVRREFEEVAAELGISFP
ncbi:MAG: Ldh family oxidoreductase [Chloroflexi bacterium]|nr:Ldh family oxidoreductase [Chloroflexota bacterium]